MKAFIRSLKEAYAVRSEQLSLPPEQQQILQSRLNALRLADAALIKAELQSDHVPHIGILGPTQAGKSTLVNLMLGGEHAGVSPLAGYTVHAQGFAVGCESSPTPTDVEHLFHDFERVEQTQLNAEQLDCFSLASVSKHNESLLPEAILWDSPDFDSVHSRGYRSAVIRVAALADTVLLVVSKDKYGDKSVWDILDLLIAVGKPLTIIINKLSESERQPVVDSFRQRFCDRHADEELPDIVTIPYLKGLDEVGSAVADDIRQTLAAAISKSLRNTHSAQAVTGARRLLENYWESWLEPVREELSAQKLWRDEVDAAIAAALASYRSGFLDHPQKYDTFNRALAELLALLEVPGLAGTLGTTRKVVTWPVRKLFQLGRNLSSNREMSAHAAADLERDVLDQILQRTLTGLGATIIDQNQDSRQHPLWWSAIGSHLHEQRAATETDFENAVINYQQAFTPHIEQAAQKLYRNLQKQPALLNTLRAARVSTDAAAVVLAVKSGGLAASDLVLAPAMLSLTTMLTEGALGKYMDSVRNDLKDRQYGLVKELFEQSLGRQLYALSNSLPDKRLFGYSDTDITAIEAEFANWQQGTQS